MSEERIAALEQRVGALVEALCEYGLPGLDARLAALRAPGVDAVAAESTETTIQYQRRKIVALQEQVATARRERDEAVAIVRDWIGWRDQHGLKDDQLLESALWPTISRARALVAGEGVPVPQCQCAEYGVALDKLHAADEDLAARDAEIAGLKEQLAEAEGARILNRNAVRLQKEKADAAQARVAELEAREREGRWIADRAASPSISSSRESLEEHREWVARRAAYLSGATPPDPARGLIERAARALADAATRTYVDGAAFADLRAYLGGGT